VKTFKLCFSLLVLSLLFGCASVTGTKSQQVAIAATCDGVQVSGASCTVSNDKGSWPTTTPGSVNLTKSYEDISVNCTAGESQGASVMSSKSNGGVWGNILLGGGIGYLVDRNTGAGFNYPTSISVPLGDDCQNFRKGRSRVDASNDGPVTRLKNLQGLYDRGLITEEELADRRKKMLDDM